jgi:hypothetical protein
VGRRKKKKALRRAVVSVAMDEFHRTVYVPLLTVLTPAGAG